MLLEMLNSKKSSSLHSIPMLVHGLLNMCMKDLHAIICIISNITKCIKSSFICLQGWEQPVVARLVHH